MCAGTLVHACMYLRVSVGGGGRFVAERLYKSKMTRKPFAHHFFFFAVFPSVSVCLVTLCFAWVVPAARNECALSLVLHPSAVSLSSSKQINTNSSPTKTTPTHAHTLSHISAQLFTSWENVVTFASIFADFTPRLVHCWHPRTQSEGRKKTQSESGVFALGSNEYFALLLFTTIPPLQKKKQHAIGNAVLCTDKWGDRRQLLCVWAALNKCPTETGEKTPIRQGKKRNTNEFYKRLRNEGWSSRSPDTGTGEKKSETV